MQTTKFSFGTTSAIISNVALIVGLNTATNTKPIIIGSLLVIALTDNISDTLGIHMYQESEGLNQKKVFLLTLTNFIYRFLTSLGFIIILFLLPLNVAVITSIIYGLLIISIVSYLIAKKRKINPVLCIAEHLALVLIVIFMTKSISQMIVGYFKTL